MNRARHGDDSGLLTRSAAGRLGPALDGQLHRGLLEIAREYYDGLRPETQTDVDARIQGLLEDPRREPDTHYDAPSDQWTSTYGAGSGLIVFAVVPERVRLIILRLI